VKFLGSCPLNEEADNRARSLSQTALGHKQTHSTPYHPITDQDPSTRRRTKPFPIPSHTPPTFVPLSMAQYTPEYIRAFQNIVTRTKSFAEVAAKQSAPTFQDQKATGRPKGCSRALSQTVTATQRSTGQTKGVQKATVNSDTPIMRGVLTTMIQGAVMETPIITTQQNKGIALYQATQKAAATHREDLCQKLYKALGIKGQNAPIQVQELKVPTQVEEPKVPIYVKAIRTHKEPYAFKKSPSTDTGHKKVPPQKDLMRSLVCFHCQKKNHYARNCRTKRRAIKNISAPSITPVTPANRFSVLEEETCLSTTTVAPALVPKLLDAKGIKKRTFDAYKIREITTKIQKLPIEERIRLVKQIKPKPKPKFSVEQIEAALPEIIKTYTDEQKLKMLHQTLPEKDLGTDKHVALIKAMKIQGTMIGQYMSLKNYVRIQFPLLHYRGQAEESALLDSGATENFIDSETVKRLRLGTKKLNL